MDLNIKQINTILKALQIASETTKIQYAQECVKERIYSQNKTGSEAYHAEQTRAIELAEDFDKLIPDFQSLSNRNNQQLNQE